MNLKIGTRKINATWSKEISDDLKEIHNIENINDNMIHYEYTLQDSRELELLEKHKIEIDYNDNNLVVFSITKKQLREFKLGAINGIREYSKIKKIIFNSKVVHDVSRILELKLSQEIGKEIDKEIMKDILKLGKK